MVGQIESYISIYPLRCIVLYKNVWSLMIPQKDDNDNDNVSEQNMDFFFLLLNGL